MHIRRTDYVNNPYHTNLSVDWYNTAKQHFNDPNILVFSDDKDWCKKSLPLDTISPFETDGEDLYAMTQCSGHIIANSSFSWWGAYLSNGEQTIIPKEWFPGNMDAGYTFKVDNGIFL